MKINRGLLLISIFGAIAPLSEVQAISQACANLSAASFSSTNILSGQTGFASGPFTSGDYLSIFVSGVLDSSMFSLVDGGGNVLAGPYDPQGVVYQVTGSISGVGVKNVAGASTVTIARAACAAATPVRLQFFDVE